MKPEERVMLDWLLERGKDAKAARSMIAAGRTRLRQARNDRRREDAAINALMRDTMNRLAGEVHSDECWKHMALSGGVCECGGIGGEDVYSEIHYYEAEELPF